MMETLDASRERQRIRNYMRIVRATVFPPHSYSKQTCCLQCRRIYNRAFMQRARHPMAGQQLLPFVDNYPVYNNP
jgi:hypothetical protein